MKLLCYFAKVWDPEFNNKHRGVNIFSLKLCVHELIEDIYFFEVNTKYISSSVLKTSEFS